MPKQRSPSSKRDREFRKRKRQQVKREKAALKGEHRENKESAPEPLTPDVRVTGADSQQMDEPVKSVSKIKEVGVMHRKRNVESSKKEQRNEVH